MSEGVWVSVCECESETYSGNIVLFKGFRSDTSPHLCNGQGGLVLQLIWGESIDKQQTETVIYTDI